MNESLAEADLIDFLRGGSIIAVVLTEDELKAGERLIKRGAVRKTWPTDAHALLGCYHLELVK